MFYPLSRFAAFNLILLISVLVAMRGLQGFCQARMISGRSTICRSGGAAELLCFLGIAAGVLLGFASFGSSWFLGLSELLGLQSNAAWALRSGLILMVVLPFCIARCKEICTLCASVRCATFPPHRDKLHPTCLSRVGDADSLQYQLRRAERILPGGAGLDVIVGGGPCAFLF